MSSHDPEPHFPAVPPPLCTKARWELGLTREAWFWRRMIAGDDARFARDMSERLRAHRPLTEDFTSLLTTPPGGTVRILDVGSGPVTIVGDTWEGRTVEVVPADPLADQFNEQMEAAGIMPRFKPVKCDAERLTEVFPRDHFDIAFSHNALDHCYDPVEAVRQMMLVTRPGGWVRLEHFANEALREDYDGLHQWNFREQHGDFIIWNPVTTINLRFALPDPDRFAVYSTESWVSLYIRTPRLAAQQLAAAHPAPSTQHPAPSTQHPAPSTQIDSDLPALHVHPPRRLRAAA